MEKEFECLKKFEGHISAEFNFNIVDLLKHHFGVYLFAVVSFRHDMVVIQTMIKLYSFRDAETSGIFTTIIPLSSLKEYDYDCPLDEVNVMISEMLVSGLPIGTKIGCINVVKDRPYRYYNGQRIEDVEPSDENDIGSSDSDSDVEVVSEYKHCYKKHLIRYEEVVEITFDTC